MTCEKGSTVIHPALINYRIYMAYLTPSYVRALTALQEGMYMPMASNASLAGCLTNWSLSQVLQSREDTIS
jgi:hypothetical protein